ncbi:hypothetical protein KC19_9G087400 [Ceratodon purpureus]|uniref:Uncharacterized protein n=1 Tax=Ceratodon purpureus TaxID=3225 RepID=A0A8T0GVM5_CERPU|nr:hypothetical protein KC19_9G087400 [Ceratodon purpureus]
MLRLIVCNEVILVLWHLLLKGCKQITTIRCTVRELLIKLLSRDNIRHYFQTYFKAV